MPAKKSTKPTKTTVPSASTKKPIKTNTLAIFAIVLTFLLFTIPIVGLVLGIIALVQIKKRNEGGKGLAIASIVISTVFIVLQIAFIILAMTVVNFSNGITSGTKSFSFNKNGNSLSIGGNLSVPSGFPSDVPIYPNSKIVLSTKTNNSEYAVTFTNSDPKSKISEYYKIQMESNGWIMENNSDSTEGGTLNIGDISSYTKGLNRASVVLSQSNDKTTAVITVAPIK
jgi:hypothetical protein